MAIHKDCVYPDCFNCPYPDCVVETPVPRKRRCITPEDEERTRHAREYQRRYYREHKQTITERAKKWNKEHAQKKGSDAVK